LLLIRADAVTELIGLACLILLIYYNRLSYKRNTKKDMAA